MAVGLYLAVANPASIADWQHKLFSNYGNPLVMVGVAFLLFPKLALGISGFETGVSVMPLVRGEVLTMTPSIRLAASATPGSS